MILESQQNRIELVTRPAKLKSKLMETLTQWARSPQPRAPSISQPSQDQASFSSGTTWRRKRSGMPEPNTSKGCLMDQEVQWTTHQKSCSPCQVEVMSSKFSTPVQYPSLPKMSTTGPPMSSFQVWSLVQFYSIDFGQSRISVRCQFQKGVQPKIVFNRCGSKDKWSAKFFPAASF